MGCVTTFGHVLRGHGAKSKDVPSRDMYYYYTVQIILDYLSLRGSRPGPLFRLVDGSPVSRAIFIDKLSMAIKYCGLDPSRYKGHNFRIGTASYAADAGMSDSQIRALGRWKSDAFHKNIRIPSLAT